MFSLVYNHLKVRIVVFSLHWNEPFICTEAWNRQIKHWLLMQPFVFLVAQQIWSFNVFKVVSSKNARILTLQFYLSLG